MGLPRLAADFTGADAPALNAFAEAYNRGDLQAADRIAAPLFAAGCADPRFCAAYGLMTLHALERPGPAAEALRRAVAGDARYAPALLGLAQAELFLGHGASAAKLARRAAKHGAGWGDVAAKALELWETAAPKEGAKIAPLARALLKSGGESPAARRTLHATLGRILDRAGRQPLAWRHFEAANALAPTSYDPEGEAALAAFLTRQATPEYFAAREGWGTAERRPLFILGFPRTGSTLLEQMLCRHPQIATCGERGALAEALDLGPGRTLRADAPTVYDAPAAAFPQRAARYLASVAPYAQDPQAARWIDKMPGNHRFVGAIHLMFPQAVIIQTRRDPRDVALSCFQQQFSVGHGFANRLDHLAHALQLHDAVAARWAQALPGRVLEVRYEALVADPEAVLRPLLAAAGLDWDPVVADAAAPAAAGAAVMTASVAQVRGALSNRSVGRWRAYAEELGPLIAALDPTDAAAA